MKKKNPGGGGEHSTFINERKGERLQKKYNARGVGG